MKFSLIFSLIIIGIFNSAYSKSNNNSMKSDQVQVNRWNNFVDELHQLHIEQTNKSPIKTTETIGGYGGGFANNKFYKEISYFNKNTNKLISIIQWEIESPKKIHTIEVFLYNKEGKVKTDFYARHLPYARNAPVQTLINLHAYDDKLHSFRQFDANGELMYETCRGEFFNKKINLHLDDEEITAFITQSDDELLNEAYASCFLNTPKTAHNYLHPSNFIKKVKSKNSESPLHMLSIKIIQDAKNPLLYLQRGELYFRLHKFEKAVADYNIALSIDNSLQQAYFLRGMSMARNGDLEAGINDLSHFIKSNPKSSLAYTKRGVRYIWASKLNLAKKDFIHATKLDNSNSEAHDDLGVIFAQSKNYDAALKHFKLAIKHDPSYQKAYHNLAMVYFLTNKPAQALSGVNKSLALDTESRNSLMLKSEILTALGQTKEAHIAIEKAEFLPEGNWSEQFTIK
ncbi:MAG: tetratricopeptide repeat protein [Woeseiaceae bacterium]